MKNCLWNICKPANGGLLEALWRLSRQLVADFHGLSGHHRTFSCSPPGGLLASFWRPSGGLLATSGCFRCRLSSCIWRHSVTRNSKGISNMRWQAAPMQPSDEPAHALHPKLQLNCYYHRKTQSTVWGQMEKKNRGQSSLLRRNGAGMRTRKCHSGPSDVQAP